MTLPGKRNIEGEGRETKRVKWWRRVKWCSRRDANKSRVARAHAIPARCRQNLVPRNSTDVAWRRLVWWGLRPFGGTCELEVDVGFCDASTIQRSAAIMSPGMTLFSVQAVLVLSTEDGSRVFAKYYSSPHNAPNGKPPNIPPGSALLQARR